MKKFYIIRHAESVENAGGRTTTPHGVALTEKGRHQAEELAATLAITPDLIVISPYIRTQQTAEPFIKKYPNVPVEVWDVHEFTYLAPDKYENKTKYHRITALADYWHNKAVDWKASETSESFIEFTGRIQAFLTKLASRKEETIVVFSHGRFIKGLQILLEQSKKMGRNDFTNEELHALKKIHAKTIGMLSPIPNVSVHEIILE